MKMKLTIDFEDGNVGNYADIEIENEVLAAFKAGDPPDSAIAEFITGEITPHVEQILIIRGKS